MSAARKYKITPVRQGFYAKVKIAQKQLGLDDDTYRAKIAGLYDGKTSITQLSISELEDFIQHLKADGAKFTKRPPMRAGKRPLADGAEINKIRALWISLYNLGVVRDPSEQALINFAKRVSGGRNKGKAALQWLTGEDTVKVIEALKAMATRDAEVCWEPVRRIDRPPLHIPRQRVVEAQWKMLADLGVVHETDDARDYAVKIVGGVDRLKEDLLDPVIEALGARIRNALSNAGYKDYPSWKADQK